jgi:anti-sigma factor RsiW
VSGTHPDEIQLLDYVEGDLDDAARGVVDAHLAGCAECAEQISRLETGREALRGAPLLEAPEQIRPELPERPSARRFTVRPRRLVAVLAPVAVVAAVVAVVATTDPSGQNEGDEGQRAAEAQTTAADSAEGGAEAAPSQALSATTVRSVAGPAQEVFQALLAKGFDASRLDDRVEVRGATRERVEVALADRPNGPVEVVVVP